MEEEVIKLLSQQKDVPRENCGVCKHSGIVSCPDCEGTGRTECPQCHGDGHAYGGVGGECPCQYSDSARENTYCSACKATGKRKCKCVHTQRLIWEDFKDILGHRTIIHIMAEQDSDKLWKFYNREIAETAWQEMPTTKQVSARLGQVEALIVAINQSLRDSMHAIVDKLPGETDVLAQAQKLLEGFQQP